MSTEQKNLEEETPKISKKPLFLGLILAFLGAGSGFYVTWSGMILSAGTGSELMSGMETEPDPFSDIAYVEIDPITISVDAQPERRLLRFRAQLEVPKFHQADVTKLLPRVIDVLNSYLRALEVEDLEDRAALTRLRAQMLRRIQVVTGQKRVNDFLIMEFVLT